MRCLNSPSVLNSLEVKIVETIPPTARHVLVVNAGDGRLVRALKAKLSREAVFSAVVTDARLLPLVDDFDECASDVWNVDWYVSRAARHGAFDYVVFYQLQEYWRGEIRHLQRILELCGPHAMVWTSFINAQAARLIARYLPPMQLGTALLSDPVRRSASLDYASFVDFLGKLSAEIIEIWGLLDDDAQSFVKRPPAAAAEWDVRGIKLKIATMADVFLWGAVAVGFLFRIRDRHSPGKAAPPRISFSAYTPHLLQALVLPYPDYQMREAALAAAALELPRWEKTAARPAANVPDFLLQQIGGAASAGRLLVLGCGWGRDLLVLKAKLPTWECVGFEPDGALAALGREVMKAHSLTVHSNSIEASLPFADQSFDTVVSLGFFSMLYEPAAKHLAAEARRVSRGTILHLEDSRGPAQGWHLKSYSLAGVYSELGLESKVQPVLVDGAPTGMYLLKVA